MDIWLRHFYTHINKDFTLPIQYHN